MDPSQLSPNYVIPIGTQVVLKRDLPVIGAKLREFAAVPLTAVSHF
jgi:hypothetical protein